VSSLSLSLCLPSSSSIPSRLLTFHLLSPFDTFQINEGYESNLGEPLRKVAEDVRKEWLPRVEEWKQKEAEARRFGDEVAAKLEKEAAVSLYLLSLFLSPHSLQEKGSSSAR